MFDDANQRHASPIRKRTRWFHTKDGMPSLKKDIVKDIVEYDGLLWIATDGQPSTLNQNDGVYACPTEGPSRGWNRQFISGIPGGEVCGPEFSGDNRSFFCGIQHPGENGGMPNSKSRWPDDDNNPPKPSVIAVQHKRKKKIGS